MAAYLKQSDQVVLILSKSEAVALRDLALHARDVTMNDPMNVSTLSARDRACRAISLACEPGSRSGGSIQ